MRPGAAPRTWHTGQVAGRASLTDPSKARLSANSALRPQVITWALVAGRAEVKHPSRQHPAEAHLRRPPDICWAPADDDGQLTQLSAQVQRDRRLLGCRVNNPLSVSQSDVREEGCAHCRAESRVCRLSPA